MTYLIRLNKSYYKTFTGLRKTSQTVAILRLGLFHETQCNDLLFLLLLKIQSIHKLLRLRHWTLYLRVVVTNVLFSMLYIIYIIHMLYVTCYRYYIYIYIYIYLYYIYIIYNFITICINFYIWRKHYKWISSHAEQDLL